MMRDTPLRSRATDFSMLILRLFAAALAISLIMGVLATALEYIRVVPLILDAEAFEIDEPAGPNETLTVEPEWAPNDGAERGGFTLLSNCIISLGFSLLLLGMSIIDHDHISTRSGLQRGVAGWVIFMGLPCAGLPPELPGMAAADLTDRQWWWVYAVVLGVASFRIAFFLLGVLPSRKPRGTTAANSRESFDALCHFALQAVILAVAVVVAAIPHLTGAPHPQTTGQDDHGSATNLASTRTGPPSEMAAAFAVWCLATAFAYWVCLGVLCARAYRLAMGIEDPLPRESLPTIELAEASASATEAL